MDKKELAHWFDNQRSIFEPAYLKSTEPWQQSGFSGPLERWTSLRQPIANSIEMSGSFLDIGCANGFLLECLRQWTAAVEINLELYGLDISAKLVELAKFRLPLLQDRIFVGNAWDWQPPLRFDYIRTELVYVPDELSQKYIRKLFDVYLKPDGKLLICQYRSSHGTNPPWIDENLWKWGFQVLKQQSGFDKGLELTRVLVIGQ